jgi:type IV secretory pathway VirB10-like protein
MAPMAAALCLVGCAYTTPLRGPTAADSRESRDPQEAAATTEPAVKVGDVIGFYIYLPPRPESAADAPAAADPAASTGPAAVDAAPTENAAAAVEADKAVDGLAAATAAAADGAAGGPASDTAKSAKDDAEAAAAAAAAAASGPPTNWNMERQKLLWRDSGVEFYLVPRPPPPNPPATRLTRPYGPSLILTTAIPLVPSLP